MSPPPPANGNESGRRSRLRRALLPVTALAASIAALCILSLTELPGLIADHSTGTGEQARIRLADGSIAYLNTDSAIDVEYGPRSRRIELLRGEAFFEVVKDPARPFDVETGSGKATALGTAYAVRGGTWSSETTVTVREGVVAALPARHAAEGPAGRTVLHAGEQIRFRADGPTAPVATVDLRHALAWTRGQISFDGLPLADALAEIDRYKPGMIVLLDRNLEEGAVTASLSLDRLDDGLAALAATQNLTVHTVSPYLTLLY